MNRLNRNTGQRRNVQKGHKLMADVTAEAGEKMVRTLQEMTDANKEMEQRRQDMQRIMHDEQMEYKRERDRLEMENIRLTLLNQGMVVHAISSLAEAIGRGGTHSSPHSTGGGLPPRSAPSATRTNHAPPIQTVPSTHCTIEEDAPPETCTQPPRSD